jgi:hypothetical protein
VVAFSNVKVGKVRVAQHDVGAFSGLLEEHVVNFVALLEDVLVFGNKSRFQLWAHPADEIGVIFSLLEKSEIVDRLLMDH